MQIEWPSDLKDSGLSSSATVDIQGTDIFRGLRVRMGAHIGVVVSADGAGAATAADVAKSELLLKTREISDITIGGQVLISNPLYCTMENHLDEFQVDVCALGCVALDGEQETLPLVQLLPGQLM